MSGAAPRPVGEWQLGNFGQSVSVGIPLGMRLDVWNDSGNGLTLTLYARNGQSVVANINQNMSFSLSGRLFSSVALSASGAPVLNSNVLWALVDEGSPPTWGPVSGEASYPFSFIIITDPFGNKLPAAWSGAGLAPAQGRFVGYLVSVASGDVSIAIVGQSTLIVGSATGAGQTFPFTLFVSPGNQVVTGNSNIVASGITL
jgi:hypothetical protein